MAAPSSLPGVLRADLATPLAGLLAGLLGQVAKKALAAAQRDVIARVAGLKGAPRSRRAGYRGTPGRPAAASGAAAAGTPRVKAEVEVLRAVHPQR